jgi:putative ABC transport system substrate-binding protein
MKRREFITLLGAAGAYPRATCAQQPAIPSVGFIALAGYVREWIDAFEAGLREQGRVPGTTIRVEQRYAASDPDRMREDIFVAAGSNAAAMIQELSSTAAIVVPSLEVFETAHVAGTIARPQGQVTGFATLHAELIPKRNELLREIIPRVRRIAFVVNKKNRNHDHMIPTFKAAAEGMGLAMDAVVVGDVAEIEGALKRAKAEGADAVVFMRDFSFESHRHVLISAATAAGLPSVFDDASFVRLGGFMSYAPDRADLFRRAATYVVKLLDGAKPSDLPIQLPAKFELAINMRTAKALGLSVPPTVLTFADEVIE